MKTKSYKAVCGLAAALAISFAARAQAQQPPRPALPAHPVPPAHTSPPANSGDAPQRTTATYGDWILECVQNDAPPSEPACDMAQVTQLQGKNVPFSRVAVGRPTKGQPVKLIVQVPVNASFRTDVHIQTGDADPGVIAPFAECAPAGCFAEFDLKEDILKKLRDANSVGKLSFADAGGHDVAVPISFKGFNEAFDALLKK
ncbi:MAG: invasion associated locus B family protein [Xanthobacteraceae bacterium]|jgi:invasion protein IalB